MNRHIISTLFLALVTTPLLAQEWHFGISASYQNTGIAWTRTEEGKQPEQIKVNNISGFDVGFAVAYDFNPYVGLESGFLFAMNGFATENNSVVQDPLFVRMDVKGKEVTNLYYLQWPLYVNGKLPVGQVDLILQAGPLFSCGVGSNTRGVYLIDGVQEEVTFTNRLFDNGLMSRFDCSIHLAIGAAIAGARLLVGYNFGIFDMAPERSPSPVVVNDIRSGGFVVSVAYLF